jgi:hypothetical protein
MVRNSGLRQGDVKFLFSELMSKCKGKMQALKITGFIDFVHCPEF